MNIFLLLIIIIAALLYFYFLNSIKSRNKSKNARSDILKWMEMTRDERYALDEGYKKPSFERKRRLLAKIRKEYAALDSSSNNKLNDGDAS